MNYFLRCLYVCLACCLPLSRAQAALKSSVPAPPLDAPSSPARVTFDAPYPLGTIIIRVHERQLYLMVGDHQALRYRVAVGQQGKAWRGAAFIKKKYVQPAWMAPSSVLRDHPTLPHVIAAGAPNNPMGARALELNLSEIAIHGTAASMRASIGSAASYGCIHMLNEDIIDLYPRVNVGTLVISEP